MVALSIFPNKFKYSFQDYLNQLFSVHVKLSSIAVTSKQLSTTYEAFCFGDAYLKSVKNIYGGKH